MARYPSGEVITVPRHTRTRTMSSLITARTVAPGPVAPLLPFLRPGLALTLRTPLRRALGRAIRLLPEGPPEEERRAAEFTIVAEARGEDGELARGVVRGKDVYGLTAVTLVHGAELMWAEGYDRLGRPRPGRRLRPPEVPRLPHGTRGELGAGATGCLSPYADGP